MPDTPETVTIYLPTPAKKAGIVEVPAHPCRWNPGSFDRASGFGSFLSSRAGKDWFLDKNEALAAAEAARLKRIASLKKQLAKLEGFGPWTEAA